MRFYLYQVAHAPEPAELAELVERRAFSPKRRYGFQVLAAGAGDLLLSFKLLERKTHEVFDGQQVVKEEFDVLTEVMAYFPVERGRALISARGKRFELMSAALSTVVEGGVSFSSAQLNVRELAASLVELGYPLFSLTLKNYPLSDGARGKLTVKLLSEGEAGKLIQEWGHLLDGFVAGEPGESFRIGFDARGVSLPAEEVSDATLARLVALTAPYWF